MTLKTTIHSLSFALATSVSALAGAQGFGAGVLALGAGVQPGSVVQAGNQDSASGSSTGADAEMNSQARGGLSSGSSESVNSKARTSTGTIGTAANRTDRIRATGNNVADTSADAKANKHVSGKRPHARKTSPAKAENAPESSGNGNAGVSGNVKSGSDDW